MPNSHSTVSMRVFKEHTCLLCNTVFKYRMDRIATASAATAEVAEQKALTALEGKLKTEVDIHPCPVCGFYQPEMVVGRREVRHYNTIWLSVPIYIVIFVAALMDLISFPLTTIIATSMAAAIVLMHVLFAPEHFNSTLNTNLLVACDEVKRGVLRLVKAEPKPNVSSVPVFRIKGALGLALSVASILPFLAGDLRALVSRWHYNSCWYPPIASQGDTMRYHFGYRRSFGRIWTGQSTAELLNAKELGVTTLDIGSAPNSNEKYGEELSAKEDQRDSYFELYEDVILNDARFGNMTGQTLKLSLNLNAEYPVVNEYKKYEVHFLNQCQFAELTLSPPGSGTAYKWTWIIGYIVGTVCSVLYGTVFYMKAKRTSIGLPTRVYPYTEDAPSAQS